TPAEVGGAAQAWRGLKRSSAPGHEDLAERHEAELGLGNRRARSNGRLACSGCGSGDVFAGSAHHGRIEAAVVLHALRTPDAQRIAHLVPRVKAGERVAAQVAFRRRASAVTVAVARAQLRSWAGAAVEDAVTFIGCKSAAIPRRARGQWIAYALVVGIAST